MTHLKEEESTERLTSLFEAVINVTPKETADPPEELAKFRTMSRKERESGGERFYSQEHIKNYLDEKWDNERHNKDCFFWLWEGYTSVKDPGKRKVIVAKLLQFRNIMLKNQHPYRALQIDFKKYPFRSNLPQSAEQDMCDIFGGRIIASE